MSSYLPPLSSDFEDLEKYIRFDLCADLLADSLSVTEASAPANDPPPTTYPPHPSSLADPYARPTLSYPETMNPALIAYASLPTSNVEASSAFDLQQLDGALGFIPNTQLGPSDIRDSNTASYTSLADMVGCAVEGYPGHVDRSVLSAGGHASVESWARASTGAGYAPPLTSSAAPQPAFVAPSVTPIPSAFADIFPSSVVYTPCSSTSSFPRTSSPFSQAASPASWATSPSPSTALSSSPCTPLSSPSSSSSSNPSPACKRASGPRGKRPRGKKPMEKKLGERPGGTRLAGKSKMKPAEAPKRGAQTASRVPVLPWLTDHRDIVDAVSLKCLADICKDRPAFGRVQDVTRHCELHLRKRDKVACLGVPIEEAQGEFDVSSAFEHNGRLMVGGCLTIFSRRDPWFRHIRHTHHLNGGQPVVVDPKTQKVLQGLTGQTEIE